MRPAPWIAALLCPLLLLCAAPPAPASAAAPASAQGSRSLTTQIDAVIRQPRYAADKRARLESAAQKAPAGQSGQPSLRYRMDELDRVVAEKNAHIAHLEDLIGRLENGRMMRLLRAGRRLLRR